MAVFWIGADGSSGVAADETPLAEDTQRVSEQAYLDHLAAQQAAFDVEFQDVALASAVSHAEQQALRDSATTKLMALGLTQEEVAALLGGGV